MTLRYSSSYCDKFIIILWNTSYKSPSPLFFNLSRFFLLARQSFKPPPPTHTNRQPPIPDISLFLIIAVYCEWIERFYGRRFVSFCKNYEIIISSAPLTSCQSILIKQNKTLKHQEWPSANGCDWICLKWVRLTARARACLHVCWRVYICVFVLVRAYVFSNWMTINIY